MYKKTNFVTNFFTLFLLQPRSIQNDTTKEKCRKFLANLLELSSREPKSVERNVRSLIQELVDCKVEPEEFCERLERLLNASPQPCLIGFLKVFFVFLSFIYKRKVIYVAHLFRLPSYLVKFCISEKPSITETGNGN